MKIMLLHEANEAEPYLASPEWCCEEKLNGERVLLEAHGGAMKAFSRNGTVRSCQHNVSRADFMIDGERVGDKFTAFDILSHNGEDVTMQPQWARFGILKQFSPFPIVRHASTPAEKRELFAFVKDTGGEGVVFKRLAAPYCDGRSADALKFKFWKSETFVVAAFKVGYGGGGSIKLHRHGQDCGWCPYDPSNGVPKLGSLAEVQFSAWTASRKLVHPKFLMFRNDVDPATV